MIIIKSYALQWELRGTGAVQENVRNKANKFSGCLGRGLSAMQVHLLYGHYLQQRPHNPPHVTTSPDFVSLFLPTDVSG